MPKFKCVIRCGEDADDTGWEGGLMYGCSFRGDTERQSPWEGDAQRVSLSHGREFLGKYWGKRRFRPREVDSTLLAGGGSREYS